MTDAELAQRCNGSPKGEWTRESFRRSRIGWRIVTYISWAMAGIALVRFFMR